MVLLFNKPFQITTVIGFAHVIRSQMDENDFWGWVMKNDVLYFGLKVFPLHSSCPKPSYVTILDSQIPLNFPLDGPPFHPMDIQVSYTPYI